MADCVERLSYSVLLIFCQNLLRQNNRRGLHRGGRRSFSRCEPMIWPTAWSIFPTGFLPTVFLRSILHRFLAKSEFFNRIGAGALMSSLPAADWLLGDRCSDANWFREDLVNMDITPFIPGRKSREKPVKYDKRRYKRRNRTEIMFGRLKD